jgi:glycerophosphoryl diester phosphodiesterase
VNTPPTIVAHRGIHHTHPENSVAALELAIREGFWVECDVHASRDGEAIVIHDETLDRTTEACGRVDSFDSNRLGQNRLAGSEETIPTLERALRTAGGGCWLVEIKPPGDSKLVRRVVDLLVRGATRWMVQSFDADNLAELWAYSSEAPGALLVEHSDALERAIHERHSAVHASHELLTPDVRDRLRGAGCSVGVWTVNEPHDIQRVLELGVDMIITDEPARVRDATAARKSGT